MLTTTKKLPSRFQCGCWRCVACDGTGLDERMLPVEHCGACEGKGLSKCCRQHAIEYGWLNPVPDSTNRRKN